MIERAFLIAATAMAFVAPPVLGNETTAPRGVDVGREIEAMVEADWIMQTGFLRPRMSRVTSR